ncbi:MAG: DUF2845 domain-containing protein [Syntrophorhabdaceae bacterium]
MKNVIFLAMLLIMFIGLSESPSYATTSDTFRCPNGAIVAINDRVSTAGLRCDAPTVISRRTVTRGLPFGYFETVEIEEWTYNLGPSRFMYYLTFENGFLSRIDIGGYGE